MRINKSINIPFFFTRKLKRDFSSKEDGESDDIVVSPVDGCISQIGKIEGKTIIQAKGRNFNLDSLLGFDEKNKENVSFFDEGNFVTLYLSPKDYHRIHMPITGDLISTTYIPGRLYSVNPLVVNNISNIYAKNERLISVFQTKVGYMAVILVGAMLVGSIETVWGGASPERKKRVCAYNRSLNFKKGEEIARFKFGSTVILLFMKNKVAWAGSAKIGKKIFTKSKLANLECLD